MYDELLIDVINHGTVGDTQQEKIVVDDIYAPWCNEAYTTAQLPTGASSKGTASLCIKVNTGAAGNVLPLHIFKCLYLNWISPDGLPPGLDHVSTRLTAYNRSHLPLYGTLHGPITWWPGHPGAQPHKVNSYWYVTDTPGPAILGLPSCQRLAVVKMPSQLPNLMPNLQALHLLPQQQQPSPSDLLMT